MGGIIMEQPIEMLMQYDMGLYEKKFKENEQRVATFLYSYLKDRLNDRIAALTVQNNLLYAWSYYFSNMAEDHTDWANEIMKSMVVHFNYLLTHDFEIEVSGGDKDTKPLYLDKTFCDVWFRTAICGMIMFEYGDEAVERADKFLGENYYYKDDECKTLKFKELPKPQEV